MDVEITPALYEKIRKWVKSEPTREARIDLCYETKGKAYLLTNEFGPLVLKHIYTGEEDFDKLLNDALIERRRGEYEELKKYFEPEQVLMCDHKASNMGIDCDCDCDDPDECAVKACGFDDDEKYCCHELPVGQHCKECEDDARGDWERDVAMDRKLDEKYNQGES